MEDLPECLLTEVLLRLPLVALYRFKSVCKKWLSLTSTPYFLAKYASRGSISPRWAFVSSDTCYGYEHNPVQAHELLIDLHYGDLKCPNLIRSNSQVMYRIMGVSNGLVLYKWDEPDDTDKWAVCNPVTRQFVVLPPRISQHEWPDSVGFLTQTEDGGVVTSFTVVKYGVRRSRFEVFSSESGKWKRSHVYISPACLRQTATAVGGILHWRMIAYDGIVAYDPHKKNYNDALRVIPFPADRRRNRIGMCGTHDGRLRYLKSTAQDLRVWVLNDYGHGDNWLLQHRAMTAEVLKDLSHQCQTILGNKTKLCPVSFHPLDPDVVYFECEDFFLSYNMRVRKSRLLNTFDLIGDEGRGSKWHRAFCLVVPPLPQSLPASPSRTE